MRQFVILLLVVLYGNVFSQDYRLNFDFSNTNKDISIYEVLPVYKLTFDTIKVKKDYRSKEVQIYKLKLPQGIKLNDTGFVHLFFTGDSNSALGRITMCIVGNYTSDSVLFWVDDNNNLDFNDDSPPFAITKNSPVQIVKHRNSTSKDDYFIHEISRYSTEDTSRRNAAREHFYNNNPENGYLTSEIDYWFIANRINIRSCRTSIDGKPVQLGLIDWDCNGLYNDMDTLSPDNFLSDKILVGKYDDTVLSVNPAAGATSIVQKTYIPINGKMYLLKDIDKSGKYIVISSTDSVYKILQAGDIIPDFKFPDHDGVMTNLHSVLVPKKYNLIEFWAYWCKPCIKSIPVLKELDSHYSDKLNIIGFHCNRSNTTMAIDAKKEHNVYWSRGFLTTEIDKELMSGGQFPYYVLIDGDKKIVKFNCKLSEIKEILRK